MPTKSTNSSRRSSKGSAKRQEASDAIELLTEDHEKVRGLLQQLEKTTARSAEKRGALYQKIAHEVRVHSRVEEELFYPAYRDAARSQQDEKLFYEAAEEHGLVDQVMDAIELESPESPVFAAKCKVLKDLIEHHIEEEEGEMFPKARKLLGKRLEELGRQMEVRKEELDSEEPEGGSTSGTREIAASDRLRRREEGMERD
jgi:hemerythrin-like domain-containing protein